MSFPTIVIAGAPKCGTSSLFAWLSAHPGVCVARDKETRFLLDADSPLRRPDGGYWATGLEGYARLFAHCDRTKAIAEATPDYLYQSTAPDVLAKLEPRPTIVFLLRRPAARVYSLYQYARNNMAILPREMSFADFVAAVRDGDPVVASKRNLRHAIDYSRYARFLERWYERFESESIRIYLTEDLSRDPIPLMTDIVAAAGLDPMFYETFQFERSNETIAVRTQWAQRLRMMLAPAVQNRTMKGWARAAYMRLNAARPAAPTAGDAVQLRQLDEEFAADNRALERLAQLDLAAWCGPAQT